MKAKAQIMIQSIAVLLALTLLFSLIFAALYYFTLISTSLFHILNWIGGCIAYAAGGALLGYCIKKKALLNAFIVAVILSIPAFLLSDFSFLAIIEILSKMLAYIAGGMILFTTSARS